VIEAFSILQESLGLPPGELSMRPQRKADQEEAAREPWPTIGSIRAELVELVEAMAANVHDEKAKSRDRQAAAKVILQVSQQDRMAKLLAAVEEGNRALGQRVAVLEQRAAERKRAQAAPVT
jgi:hypothetical protein